MGRGRPLSHQDSAAAFVKALKEVLDALVGDSVDCEERRVWCPWSSENKIKLGLEKGITYTPYALHFPGLQRMGIITKVKVEATPHWAKYQETIWKPSATLLRRHVYEILDRERLEALSRELPAQNLTEWNAFVRTGKRSQPPVIPGSSSVKLTLKEAIKAVVEAVEEDSRPVHALSRALFVLTHRLHKLTRR